MRLSGNGEAKLATRTWRGGIRTIRERQRAPTNNRLIRDLRLLCTAKGGETGAVGHRGGGSGAGGAPSTATTATVRRLTTAKTAEGKNDSGLASAVAALAGAPPRRCRRLPARPRPARSACRAAGVRKRLSGFSKMQPPTWPTYNFERIRGSDWTGRTFASTLIVVACRATQILEAHRRPTRSKISLTAGSEY